MGKRIRIIIRAGSPNILTFERRRPWPPCTHTLRLAGAGRYSAPPPSTSGASSCGPLSPDARLPSAQPTKLPSVRPSQRAAAGRRLSLSPVERATQAEPKPSAKAGTMGKLVRHPLFGQLRQVMPDVFQVFLDHNPKRDRFGFAIPVNAAGRAELFCRHDRKDVDKKAVIGDPEGHEL